MPNEREISFNKYWIIALVFLLLFLNIYIFWLIWRTEHRKLTFAMLDIGQGDALYIESPTGTQMLVDGGPPGQLMKQLPKMMPFFDKKIDAIMITNPDQDHIAGFADVLKSYKVGQVFEPGTFNESKIYQSIETAVKEKNIPDTIARRGMRIDMGGGAVVDVLFPDRDVSTWTTNDGSIMAKLTYGTTSIMLTGDATAETEKILLSENSVAALHSTILKVGHHGSRTSTSPDFVQAVNPTYAVISDGRDNKYGHPHQETLDTLGQFGVQILRTDLVGNIILKSDGQNADFSFHR